MKYRKVEKEIDNLLHNGGLNPYERKLLRKAKRKLCEDNEIIRNVTRLFREHTVRSDEIISAKCKIIEEIEKGNRLKDSLIEEYLKEWEKEKERASELKSAVKYFKLLSLLLFCGHLFNVFYRVLMK